MSFKFATEASTQEYSYNLVALGCSAAPEQTTEVTKTCTKCGETHSAVNFRYRKASIDKLNSQCRFCDKADSKAYREKNKEALERKRDAATMARRAENPAKPGARTLAERREVVALATKGEILCLQCQKISPIANFYKSATATIGYRRRCKDCIMANEPKYVESRKNSRTAYYAKVMSDPDKLKHKRQYKANYQRVKKQNDLQFATEKKVRDSIYSAIKRTGAHKSSRTHDYLGCTIAEACAHIESKFKVGMSWENWSMEGWHLDHVRPIASFDKANPNWTFEANHYTNLQPLWAIENLTKSDKWETNGN